MLNTDFFEMGDKPGQLLARLAAGRQKHTPISSLKDGLGKSHYETKAMTEIMEDFYKRLYTSEASTSMECIYNFLVKLNLPSLSEKDQGILGRPVTCVEVVEAINSLQKILAAWLGLGSYWEAQ